MKTRVLEKDLKVSAVGLGCMGFSHAYGAPVEREETIRLLRRAEDMGYTFFDTAGTWDIPFLIPRRFTGRRRIPM